MVDRILGLFKEKVGNVILALVIIATTAFYYSSNYPYLVYSILCFVLFIYLGLGLTMLICPKELRRCVLSLSPLVGYCYLTLVGWYLYNLGFNGTDEYYTWILIPPLILLLVNLFLSIKSEIKKNNIVSIFKKELIAPLIVSFIAFSVLSYASISEPQLTSISLGNNDVAAYSLQSRMVKEMSSRELVGFAKQNGDDRIKKEVFGAYFYSAFFSSVFKLETYQIQNIMISIFFVFSILLTYCLAREVLGYNQMSSVSITMLYGLNPIMYYTIYQGFQSQIITTGLSVAIFLINWHVINIKNFSGMTRYLPLLVLLTWGFSLTYPHMLPIIYAPLIVFVLLSSLQDKVLRPRFMWGILTTITLLSVFVLSPFRIHALVDYFLLMKEVIAGWFIPWISPETFYGFTFRNVYLSQPLPTHLRLILSTPLVMLIAYGMVKLFHKDRKRFLFSLAIMATVTAGYILLILPGAEQQQLGGNGFGGYKHYKLLSFFLPVLLITSLVIFRDLDYRARKGFKFFLLVCFIVLLTANIVSAYLMSREMERVHVSVDREVIELQKVEKEDWVGSINIPSSSSWWTIMWEHNFLLMKKLYDQQDTYYPKTTLEGEWNLVRNQERDILTVKYIRPTESIFVNSRYSLIKSSNTFFAVLGDGWHGSEVTHRWTSSNVSTVIIYSNSNNTRIRLEVYFSPLDMANRLSIYLNGRIIQNYTSEQGYSIENLSLDYGRNVVEFKSLMQPMIPSNGDPRQLGYSFSLIKLEEV